LKSKDKKKSFIGAAELLFAFLTSFVITAGRCIYNLNDIKWLKISAVEYVAIFAILFVPVLFFYVLLGKLVRKGMREKAVSFSSETLENAPGGKEEPSLFTPGEEIDLLAIKDDKTIEKEEKEMAAKARLPFIYRILPFMTFILVLASCAFAMLAYFPGILAYDSEWQTLQAIGLLPLSNHHPVLHTLIWNAFLLLEWAGVPHPYALTIYCIFQMILVSFVCSYVVKREISEGCRWYYELLTIAFYVFYPAFSVFSVEMTKDVLFSCMVVLLVLRLLKASRGERVSKVLLFCNIALACLLRNNFLPAAFVLIIAMIFSAKKENMRGYLITSVFSVIFSCVVMLIIYPLAGVQSSESREALSVPINQVASVYVGRYSNLTVAEKFLIEKYMSAGEYNPRLADSVKFTFDDDLYKSDRSAFWDLYMHLFYRYPEEFINAFLTQNVQLWYPGARITDRYSGRDYIETDNVFMESYYVERRPLVREAELFYENMITYIENSGLLSGLAFSLSIPFITFLCAFYMAVKIRRPSYTAVTVMLFALWGTYLLGPVSAFRYMYTFFLLIPVMMMPVFSGRLKASGSEK